MNENEVDVSTEELDDFPYDPEEADEEWDAVKWGKEEDGESESEPEADSDKPESSEPADQPEEEAEKKDEPAEPEAEPEAKAEDADQWLELKHMDDEPRKVSKEEAKALAQKGLDYDRIREERDNLKTKLPRYEAMENFLKEMQGDFDSIEDFMDDTRARIKADAEGISYNDALAQVKSAKAPAPQPESNDNGLNVDAFVAAYPEVKAEDIPASVWAKVRETGDLVGAYREYDESKKNDKIAELEREIEALKNNKKNSERSTGSSKSAGATGTKSLIASLWDNDE